MKRLFAAAVLCAASAAWAGPVDDAKAVNVAFVAAASVEDPAESVRQVAALFVDNMRHIGVFGVVKGKPALIERITPAFRAPGRKSTLLSNEGVALDADTVLTVSKFTNEFTDSMGNAVKLPLRCTRLIKKQKDGKYLIVAEHTSFGPPPPQR